MRAMMLQRISRTLVAYREAVVWYALLAVAVALIASAGPPSGHTLPAQPHALPPLRTVGATTTTAQPPPTTRPPPTATTSPPPPTATSGPATTGTSQHPNRPGQ